MQYYELRKDGGLVRYGSYDYSGRAYSSIMDIIRTRYADYTVYFMGDLPDGADTTDIEVFEFTPNELKAAGLSDLDSQYSQDKQELASQYLDAVMSGDNDTAAAIKTELAALNEKYDTDYQSIVSKYNAETETAANSDSGVNTDSNTAANKDTTAAAQDVNKETEAK